MTTQEIVEETALNIAMMNNAFFVTAELDAKEYGDKLLEILTTTAQRVREETIREYSPYIEHRIECIQRFEEDDECDCGLSTLNK